MKNLVKGGAVLVGSDWIKLLINDLNHDVVKADKLTSAGNLQSLKLINNLSLYAFDKIDICDY